MFNTHLDHISSSAREEQVSILLPQIQQIAGLHISILTGDFNCDEESSPYHAITNSFYTDSRSTAKNIVNGTLKSFTEFHKTEEIPQGRYNIDFIFTSGFDTSSWELISDLTKQKRALSDHRAIVSELVRVAF